MVRSIILKLLLKKGPPKNGPLFYKILAPHTLRPPSAGLLKWISGTSESLSEVSLIHFTKCFQAVLASSNQCRWLQAALKITEEDKEETTASRVAVKVISVAAAVAAVLLKLDGTLAFKEYQ